MGVHNIRTEGEFHETLKNHKVVLIDFYATWCGPSKEIAPIVVECSNNDQYQDVYFAKVDVDDLKQLVKDVGVSSFDEQPAMPTLALYKYGNKVGQVVGASAETAAELLEKRL